MVSTQSQLIRLSLLHENADCKRHEETCVVTKEDNSHPAENPLTRNLQHTAAVVGDVRVRAYTHLNV